MNAATLSCSSLLEKDFAGGIEARNNMDARELAFEFSPRFAIPGFFSMPLAQSQDGITGFVNRIVVGQSARLSPLLRQRIAELSALDMNWDDEGAKAVKSYILADVVEVLKRFAREVSDFQEPFLAPTFDGLVQMEWHNEKRSLEIEAIDQGWSLVGTMIGNSDGKRLYFTAGCERSDFQKLIKFYNWYAGAEMLWPSL